MRLALAAGRLDVDDVLAGMSGRQLAEWQAFEKIEGGIGSRGEWNRTAHLLAMYSERHRDPKQRNQPFRVQDFLPWIQAPAADAARTLRARLARWVKKKP